MKKNCLALTVLLLAPLVVPQSAESKPAQPNVLLICVDDLKPLLGCYGDPVIKTPNMDRLARRGVLFEKACCNQAVCAPSRNTLMTGLRPTTFAPTGWGELRQYSDIPQVGPVSDDQARLLIHGYHAPISYVDAQIGRVLDELGRLGLDKTTIVVLWGAI